MTGINSEVDSGVLSDHGQTAALIVMLIIYGHKWTYSSTVPWKYKVKQLHTHKQIWPHLPGSIDFTTLWANSAHNKLMIFFLFFSRKQDLTFHTNCLHWYFDYFSQKTGYGFSCKLSPMETICMKCQILVSGKNKKKYHQYVICWISPESGKG